MMILKKDRFIPDPQNTIGAAGPWGSIIVCLVFLLMPGFLLSQSGIGFVNFYPDARGISLSGADLTKGGSAFDMSLNPALLLSAWKNSLALSHFDWMSMKNESAGYVRQFPFGTAGINATFMYSRTVNKTDLYGNDLGRMDVYAWAVRMGLARSFISQKLSVGVNIKYLRSVLDEYSGGSFSMDAGGLYVPGILDNRLRIGLVLGNLGTPLKYKDQNVYLPFMVQPGVSYLLLELRDHVLTAFASSRFSTNDAMLVPLALEYGFYHTGFARLSYVLAKENIRSFSLGLGVDYKRLTADFAYVPGVGVDVISYAVTLGYRW